MFNRGIVGGGVNRVEAVFTNDPRIDTDDKASYTFLNVDIGDAHPKRMVAVAGEIKISNLAVPDSVSVTVNGVAATVVYQGGPFIGSFVAYRKVPNGTTANVIVTRGSPDNPSQCGIATFAFNTTEVSADDTVTDTATSGSLSGALTVKKGGAVIYAYNQNGTGGSSANWTGAETVNNAANANSESIRRTFGQVDIEEDSTSNLTFATNGNFASMAAAFFIF